MCLGFKVHDLIACESKVEVVVFLGSLATTQRIFVNRGFILKTHQMFSVHTTWRNYMKGSLELSHGRSMGNQMVTSEIRK